MNKKNKKLWIILILALPFLGCLVLFYMDFEEILKRQHKQARETGLCGGASSVPDSAYPWVAKVRMTKVAPYLNENDTVLEYGVRFGWNLALLKCKRKIGFDPSESFSPFVRQHGIEFIHDLAAIPDGSIDVVVCHHVLEHTLIPVEVLNAIRRILHPKGKLLLFVPYEKGKGTQRYNSEDRYHRLYSWNVQTLGNLLEANGFRVVEGRVGRFGYDRFSAVWADRYHLGEWGFRALRRAIHLVRPSFEVEIVADKNQYFQPSDAPDQEQS